MVGRGVGLHHYMDTSCEDIERGREVPRHVCAFITAYWITAYLAFGLSEGIQRGFSCISLSAVY
jgi:hypothetical protein